MLSPLVMETIKQDVSLAIRFLRKNPGFTLPAVLTLALGIGANATIFSLTDALLFRPLAVPDADRIVHVYQRRADRPPDPFPLSMPDYEEYLTKAPSFEVLAAHYPTSPMHVIVGDEPISITGAVATASYFDVLQIRPAIGRFFTAEEDRVRGRDAVVVVNYGFWQRHFGGRDDAIGSSVQINGRPFTIVGVTPRGFAGVRVRGAETEAWIPSAMFANGYRYCDAFDRGCTIIDLLGRVKPGVTVETLQRELDVLAAGIAAAYPATNKDTGVLVVAARGLGLGGAAEETRQLALFLFVVAVVLLIACANVAGLLMARATARRKELAMRLALGASRGRLVRQLLTETFVLASAGTAAGLIVATWGNALLEAVYAHDGAGRPVYFPLTLNTNVFLATAAIAIVSALVVGLVPSLVAGRTDVMVALKDESGSGGGRRSRMRYALVTAQVAMSVTLLIGAALLLRSVQHLNRGSGFDPDQTATLRLRPSLVEYSRERSHAFQRQVLDAVAAVPGVTSVSPSVFLSLFGGGAMTGLATAATEKPQRTVTAYTGARYFESIGVPMLAGRDFSDADTATSMRVVIVNDVLAAGLWPGRAAVGETLLVNGTPHTVIGVARDAQFYAAGESPRTMVFINYWQSPARDTFMNDSRLMVRVAGDTAPLLPAIRRAIGAVDPNVPISETHALRERVQYIYQPVRFARTMISAFAFLALVLSAVGVYGVLAFSVLQRTRELAIRLALGATRIDVAAMVLREGAVMTVIGVALGVAGAWSSSRLMASFLYGIQPDDPLAFVAGPIMLAAVAVVACVIPARRAARVSASAALRCD
jgi:predicted permease